MINTIFFAINILLALIIWKYMLRKSLLDHFRDKLFDIRDEVREYYILKNISLDDITYITLRELLNSQLRFIDNWSIYDILYASYKIKDDHIKSLIKNEINSKLSTDDEKLSEFIIKIRGRSGFVISNYIVFSSLPFVSLMIITSLCCIPLLIFKWMFQSIRRELNLINDMLLFFSKVVNRFVGTQDDIEEISYESFRAV